MTMRKAAGSGVSIYDTPASNALQLLENQLLELQKRRVHSMVGSILQY